MWDHVVALPPCRDDDQSSRHGILELLARPEQDHSAGASRAAKLSWHLRGASVNFDSLEVARTDISLEAEWVDNDSVKVNPWAAVRTCERTSDSTTEDDLLSATVAYNTNSGDAMEEIDCAESAANLNVRLVDEFAKSFSLPRVEADAVK